MKKCVIPPGELKRLLTFRWSNVAENFYPAELLKKCTIQRIINEGGEKYLRKYFSGKVYTMLLSGINKYFYEITATNNSLTH